MLTCFFYSHGIAHHEHTPQGQTINKEYHLEVLHCLHDAVHQKWLDMWAVKIWQLQQDNVPAHSAHIIQAFLVKNNTPLVGQVPNYPDLASCDLWLLLKLKTDTI